MLRKTNDFKLFISPKEIEVHAIEVSLALFEIFIQERVDFSVQRSSSETQWVVTIGFGNSHSTTKGISLANRVADLLDSGITELSELVARVIL